MGYGTLSGLSLLQSQHLALIGTTTVIIDERHMNTFGHTNVSDVGGTGRDSSLFLLPSLVWHRLTWIRAQYPCHVSQRMTGWAFPFVKAYGCQRAGSATTSHMLSRMEAGTALNTLYMFYNASIQGSTRLLKALKESKKARMGAIGLVGVGSGLHTYNMLVDRDNYEKLPQYIKDTNMVIMKGDGSGESYRRSG